MSTRQKFLPGRATGSVHSSGVILQRAALRTRDRGVTQKETLLRCSIHRVGGVGQSLIYDIFHGSRVHVRTMGGLKEVVKAANKTKPLNLPVQKTIYKTLRRLFSTIVGSFRVWGCFSPACFETPTCGWIFVRVELLSLLISRNLSGSG